MPGSPPPPPPDRGDHDPVPQPPRPGRTGASALPRPGDPLLPRRTEVLLALLLAPATWLATFDPQPAVWRALVAAGLSDGQLRALIAARRSLPACVAVDSVGRSTLGSILFRAAQAIVVAAWFLVQLAHANLLGPYSGVAVLRLVALAGLLLVALAVGGRWALYSARRELIGLGWEAVTELCRTPAPGDHRIRATRRPTAGALLRRAARVAATRLAPPRTASPAEARAAADLAGRLATLATAADRTATAGAGTRCGTTDRAADAGTRCSTADRAAGAGTGCGTADRAAGSVTVQVADLLRVLAGATSWHGYRSAGDPAPARPAQRTWPAVRGVLAGVLLAGAAATPFLPRAVWAPPLAAVLAIAAASVLGGPNALPRRIAAALAYRLRHRPPRHHT